MVLSTQVTCNKLTFYRSLLYCCDVLHPVVKRLPGLRPCFCLVHQGFQPVRQGVNLETEFFWYYPMALYNVHGFPDQLYKVIVCSPALAMFPYDTFCISPKWFSRHSAFVLLQVWPIRASLRSKDSEVLVKTSFTFSDCLRTASTNGSTVFSKVISIFSVSANFIAWLLSLSSWGKQKSGE
jgi:hypothetical protein